ncbi:MAG: hypothetical protein WKG01_29305 [Kofleriaceae bacterium]
MAMTAAYALAHVFLPNLVKLKSAATVLAAIERKEKSYLDAVWQQAHVTHDPYIAAIQRDGFRIGIITLPPPKEMGEAHMIAIVTKKTEPSFNKYYLLEHDYVLAKQADRTLVTERDGQRHIKHFDGPVLTGTIEPDVTAFIDAFMELHIPTHVAPKR